MMPGATSWLWSGCSPPFPVTADEPIQLATPDPSWPAQFEQERAALDEAISKWVCGGIHHMGGTAVPKGLEAKPIIDILAGVHDLETAHACFGPLADLGYLYAPYLGLEARLDEVAATLAVARVVVDEDLALDAAADQDARLVGDGVVAEDVRAVPDRTGLPWRSSRTSLGSLTDDVEPSGSGSGGAEPERQRGRVSEAPRSGCLVAAPAAARLVTASVNEPSGPMADGLP